MEGNQPTLSQLQSDFPGINFVRLAIYDYASPSALDSLCSTLTVGRNRRRTGRPYQFDRQQRRRQLRHYLYGTATVERIELVLVDRHRVQSNPYVWFGTDNEPSETDLSGNTDPAALSTWQQQTYNAIRDTGNTSPIMVEMNGGSRLRRSARAIPPPTMPA